MQKIRKYVIYICLYLKMLFLVSINIVRYTWNLKHKWRLSNLCLFKEKPYVRILINADTGR